MQSNQAVNPARDVTGASDATSDLGYANAKKTAIAAFDLINAYHAPPIPEAYEIFYAYACRNPMDVIARVDDAAAINGIIDLHQIHGIHSDLFSFPEALRNHQESTNQKLDTAMSEVLEMVQSHLKRNADYSNSLDEASVDLNAAPSPEALRRTVEKLLLENEKSRVQSQKLANSLEASQTSIREMRDQLSQAREDGLRDPLTRLHNRRHFDSVLRTEIAASLENDRSLCLIMVDVDHFKQVNDTFGHPAGDAVLRVLGQLLAENVKGRDIPVRYGGEEFAIILPDTALVGAKVLANEIRRQLERKKLSLRDTGQDLGKITASFGVTELQADDTPVSLIARADKYLYQAKKNGRNRVEADGD